jgi:hypothetical protein
MNEDPKRIAPRQQGLEKLIGIARIVLSGTLIGWILSRVPLGLDTWAALGLLVITVPIHILTPPPVRLCVRIAGLTVALVAIRQLVEGEDFMAPAVAAWIVLATIAANRHIKRC